MPLILINATYGSDTNCRVIFNNFTVGFLNMLVFQTVWRNKKRTQNQNQDEEGGEVGFQVYEKFTDVRL